MRELPSQFFAAYRFYLRYPVFGTRIPNNHIINAYVNTSLEFLFPIFQIEIYFLIEWTSPIIIISIICLCGSHVGAYVGTAA